MPKYTEYVVGFMFQNDKVALIRKNRPEWQKGKLNGIGGHIEVEEKPVEAMCREFQEETGLETEIYDWKDFAELVGSSYIVHFFYSKGDLSLLKTTTDEEIVVLPVKDVTVENAIPNLTWLIPLAKSLKHYKCRFVSIQENYE
jgi:8-oxo-dGTP diphosphatase